MTGTYHEVALFLDRVGKLPRIVNIRNIKMVDPDERSGRIVLQTSGEAVTYRFIEKEAAPGAPGTDGTQPRRRGGNH